jgi:hypothetical protein
MVVKQVGMNEDKMNQRDFLQFSVAMRQIFVNEIYKAIRLCFYCFDKAQGHLIMSLDELLVD